MFVLIPEPFINQTFFEIYHAPSVLRIDEPSDAFKYVRFQCYPFANSFYERVGQFFASDFSYEKFIRSLIGQLNQQLAVL
jgi:hypothetical protein